MKVFTCNDQFGNYRTATVSVIVAETEERARELLLNELISNGIGEEDEEFTLQELNTNVEKAFILSDDGD